MPLQEPVLKRPPDPIKPAVTRDSIVWRLREHRGAWFSLKVYKSPSSARTAKRRWVAFQKRRRFTDMEWRVVGSELFGRALRVT